MATTHNTAPGGAAGVRLTRDFVSNFVLVFSFSGLFRSCVHWAQEVRELRALRNKAGAYYLDARTRDELEALANDLERIGSAAQSVAAGLLQHEEPSHG